MITYSLDELCNNRIILCPQCKGKGKRVFMFDSNIKYVNYAEDICKNCGGKGRMKIKLEKIIDKPEPPKDRTLKESEQPKK